MSNAKKRNNGAGTGRGRAAGLETVTALLCTGRDFPGELGADYPAACDLLGLPPRPGGYALRLAQDRAGARWTIVSSDVDRVGSVLSIHAMGIEASWHVDAADVDHVRPGWPLACPLALAGRGDPHDPPGPPPVWTPAYPPSWAPTGRRVFADQIVRELREPADASSREMARLDLGLDPAEGLRLLDLAMKPGTGQEEPAVLAALEQARSLAATPVPFGTVRADWNGDHPLLMRATGASWSLAARPRTGPVIVLLDAFPGCVFDATRAQGLDDVLGGLLQAATAPGADRRGMEEG